MAGKGFTIWFTGLSGAGKSTLAEALEPVLKERGHNVEILDGDVVRTNLSKGLGFSKEDRDTNILRIGFVAHLLSRNGVAVITAAISPYRDIRDQNRALIGDFVEVYAKCSHRRADPPRRQGPLREGAAGEIQNFTGISDPYEAPENPEVVVDSEKETVEESMDKILAYLEAKGYIATPRRVSA